MSLLFQNCSVSPKDRILAKLWERVTCPVDFLTREVNDVR